MRSTVTPLRDGRTKTGGWRGGGCDMGRFGEVHRKFPPLRTNSSFVLIGSVRVCGRGLGFPRKVYRSGIRWIFPDVRLTHLHPIAPDE